MSEEEKDLNSVWDNTPMLERVRKLLAKAENPACSSMEAEALNVKAAELIVKYGIDQALLENSAEKREEIGERVIQTPAPYSFNKALLLGAIAKCLKVALLVKSTNVGGRITKHTSVHMFGYQSDLERVEILYTSLLTQMSLQLAALQPPRKHQVIWRSSWMRGFVHSVLKRLEAAEQRAMSETGDAIGTALVLRDRMRDAEAALAAAYPKTQPLRRHSRHNEASYVAGRVAGERADLGGTRVTQGSQRALDR